MKTINGNLVLEEDTHFTESIHVEGSILGRGGQVFSLMVDGSISATGSISARDISAWRISARSISARDISAVDIIYHAFCVAHGSITCHSISGRRENSFHKALDGEVKVGVEVGVNPEQAGKA